MKGLLSKDYIHSFSVALCGFMGVVVTSFFAALNSVLVVALIVAIVIIIKLRIK